MKYKHIFFDLDHTLWDFDANSRYTLEELYESFGLRERGVYDFELFYTNYLVHNEKLWSRYRNGFIKAEELRWKRMWLTLIDFKIGDEKLARDLAARFLELLPDKNRLFPHTLETLEYLSGKQYRLHLITNGFNLVQHRKLRNSGLDKFFKEVVTSESCNSIKPHKEIFEYAFAKTGAQLHESIMVGDSMEADIQGAINAGIDQLYVNYLRLDPVIRPTYMVNSLKELEGIF